MASAELKELVHADIDGELDAAGRAELARALFADPKLRKLRTELLRVCAALDQVPGVDPPPDLQARIRDALPQTPRTNALRQSRAVAWRYAALAAGVLVSAAVLFESGSFRRSAPAELAGTLSAPRATLDTVRLPDGPVGGRVSLYREGGGFGVEFELIARGPVDAVIASGGQTVRVTGLGRPDSPGGPRTRVLLPAAAAGQAVELSFLMAEHEVASAVLKVPPGP